MTTIDDTKTSAHEAVDRVASAANEAAEALGAKGDQLRIAEQRLVATCRDYIRDNPVTSLGIAAAAGFLVSRLLARR